MKPIQMETWRKYSSEAQPALDNEQSSIISDNEKVVGESEKLEFQAETAELLNIVAKSLYSETEVSDPICFIMYEYFLSCGAARM